MFLVEYAEHLTRKAKMTFKAVDMIESRKRAAYEQATGAIRMKTLIPKL